MNSLTRADCETLRRFERQLLTTGSLTLTMAEIFILQKPEMLRIRTWGLFCFLPQKASLPGHVLTSQLSTSLVSFKLQGSEGKKEMKSGTRFKRFI